MSQQENQYPVLPAEFSGERLLTLTQAQIDELQMLHGEDAVADRVYQYIQSLA